MQPYIPFLNVAKVEITAEIDNQRVQNVFHMRCDLGWTSQSASDLLGYLDSWLANVHAPVVGAHVEFVELKLTDLTTQTGLVAELQIGTIGELTGVGQDALPNGTAVVVKWTTAARGRSYRGRTYHFGLTQSQVTLNNLEPAARTAIGASYNTMFTQMQARGWPMVVASRVNNGVLRTTGVATVITGWSIDPVIDSQRRRLPGRGR